MIFSTRLNALVRDEIDDFEDDYFLRVLLAALDRVKFMASCCCFIRKVDDCDFARLTAFDYCCV